MTWQKCCGNASRSTAPRLLVLAGGARNRYCYLVRSAGVVDTGEVRGGEGKGWGKKEHLWHLDVVFKTPASDHVLPGFDSYPRQSAHLW